MVFRLGWAGLVSPVWLHSMSASLEERTRNLGSARTGISQHNLCSMAGSRYLYRKMKLPASQGLRLETGTVTSVLFYRSQQSECPNSSAEDRPYFSRRGVSRNFHPDSLSLPPKMAVETHVNISFFAGT